MRLGHRLAAAGAVALLLLSVAASAAFGYAGQVAVQVTAAGPAGTLPCNTALVVTATVLDGGGIAVDGRDVVWTFGAGMHTGDHIVLPTTTTNASGVTSTTVVLACIVGNRTIVATATPASGQVVLGITLAGLPLTGTSPDSTPLWPYVLALLGICLGSFMIGRRVLQGR
jgi:hypothetical protein